MGFVSFLKRKKITITVFVVVLAIWYLPLSHYHHHKEEILAHINEIVEKVSFPFKLAKLRRLPPDTELIIPIAEISRDHIADTWGEPRGSGRVHEGVDIFAKRGTPVYAAASGYVMRTGFGSLGGNYVFTMGSGGVRYYYAHLDSIAPGIETGAEIHLGTVLGFVGDSGNAKGTPPHLHFGMYFSGPQNPYGLLFERDVRYTEVAK